jgi:RNA polymerase sigma-70 factor (ECF subfamily)
VAEHGKRAYNLGLRVTGDHHDAEDVCQELFLRIWKMGAAFLDVDRPDSWVYRVALNLSLDIVYRRRKSPAGPAPGGLEEDAMENGNTPAPERAAGESELKAILRSAVDGLPRAQREVFVLRNDEGLSYGEISKVLACPEGRARANFYQAMKSLRRSLEGVAR